PQWSRARSLRPSGWSRRRRPPVARCRSAPRIRAWPRSPKRSRRAFLRLASSSPSRSQTTPCSKSRGESSGGCVRPPRPGRRRERAPATVARKLAALRGLFQTQIELGSRESNPAELVSSPKRPQRLPHVLKPDDVARLLDGIAATTPLELRDRAMFELAYACGL